MKKNCLRFVTWFLVFWFSTDFLSFFKPLFDIHRYLRPFPFRQTKFIWLIQGSFFCLFSYVISERAIALSIGFYFWKNLYWRKVEKNLSQNLNFFINLLSLTHCVRHVITFNGIIILLYKITIFLQYLLLLHIISL